jgi:hypothetical protein
MKWPDLVAIPDGPALPDSFFVLGLHKSGSTLMHQMVRDVCIQASISNLNIPALAFQEGIAEDVWSADNSLVPIFKQKRLFFGFRFFPQILSNPDLNIRNKKFILLVRDPRDALVSAYFSYGGMHLSHRMPGKNADLFLARIQKTAHLDIDDYVIRRAKGSIKRMAEYRDGLDFNKGRIFRYEDIYFDKLTFLKAIFDHFDIAVDDALLARVAAKHDVRPKQEDVSKHIRKGEPGDYVNKLKPETVEKLNTILSDVAAAYEYDLR